LIDIARKNKQELYIAFIDYQKAYDKVNRKKLIEKMDRKGCGTKFLMALQRSMSSIGTIGNKQFQTSSGVKQGGGSSCNAFTFYIDQTIDAVKSVGPNGWLEDTHILLFMDDTVIFATSRAKMEQKLSKLKQSADSIDMVIHPTKSKFLTVNTNDKTPFKIDNVIIDETEHYMYLGARISNSSIPDQIAAQLHQKYPHQVKFSSFLTKNNDCPFNIKKTVWDSAFKSAIYYGCETWLTRNIQVIERPYIKSLKHLLGVRQTTCTDTMLVELGVGDAKSMVKDRQMKFLAKLDKRTTRSYIHNVIDLAIQNRTTMGTQIQNLRNNPKTHTNHYLSTLKDKLRTATSTKRQEYTTMNPTLEPCPLYKQQDISESNRVACTRIRLSSHNLRIETGRWARIPRDLRQCQCKEDIQTEEHVLLRCPLSSHLRSNMEQYNDISTLFKNIDYRTTSILCNKVLKLYENLN
jgi:hypothetical protein